MSGYQTPLLTAIAIAAVKKHQPNIEREIHRAAHNEIVGTPCKPEDIECYESVSFIEIGDLHFQFYLKADKGTPPAIVTQIRAENWTLLPGGLLFLQIPEARKLHLFRMVGETLGEADAVDTAPWKDMRFIKAVQKEDCFHLTVPQLENQNIVGSIGHDGLRTWTGEWM
tara:strand:+ start:5298 stop:5804 length:507 start_codon:yes stop_codon:yes gene_type:complete